MARSEEKVKNQGLPLDLLPDTGVPYRAEDGALLLCDARQLREIPDASVDLVTTDPPFNVGISYGVGLSDHLTEKQYQAFTGRWLTEALRVLPSLPVRPETCRTAGTGKWRTYLGGVPEPVGHRCLAAIRESLEQNKVRQ